jgi:hypothetical protein
MTLATMYGLVSARLNEGANQGGPTLYPTAEIVAAINEAYRFFCLLTLGLEETTAWTVPAATTFFHMLTVSDGLFADWIVPLRIATVTGAKVRPARVEDLTSLDTRWVASPGAPYRYAHLGADLLALYQQPAGDSTVLNVTYARAPLALVEDADTPETPAEYSPKFVDYGIYRCRQMEGADEFAKALPLLGSFLEGAAHYAAYVRSRNLGSRYDKVPFEIEAFDTSKLLKLRADLPPMRPRMQT